MTIDLSSQRTARHLRTILGARVRMGGPGSTRAHFKASCKFLSAALSLVLLAGCDKPKISVYRVPKEPTTRAQTKLSWTLPAGWQEGGSARMSVASFTIAGEGGQQAQVTCTPLPALGGRDVEIINMWRQQAGQPELSAEEAAAQLQSVEVAGETGKLFEVTSKSEGTNAPMRIVTAMMHRPDASWFFKLSGDAAVVGAQKPAFIEFLKSLQLKDAPQSPTEPEASQAASAAPQPSRYKWKVPAGWQAAATGQMQAARFVLPTQGTAKAEVSVSVFGSATGGKLLNVNRWRGMVGLPPVGEGDVSGLVAPLDATVPDAMLMDATNNGKRILGAAYPRGGQWFFYKMLGDEAAVAAQKDAFVAFVKSEP